MECIMKNKNKKCFTFYVKYYWIPTEILQQLMLLLSYPKGYCTVHQKRCQSRVRGHLWQEVRLCHWGESVSRSVVSNSATPWVAHQATLLMEFSGQKCWSRLLLPIPGDLSDPGIQPRSHFVSRFITIWATREVFVQLGQWFNILGPTLFISFICNVRGWVKCYLRSL